MMKQPIQQRGGDDGIAEDLAPFGKAAIGGEDHGAALVAGVDELEEQIAAAVNDRQVADFVDDQERGPAKEPDALAQSAFAFGLGESAEDVGQACRSRRCGRPSLPRHRARWRDDFCRCRVGPGSARPRCARRSRAGPAPEYDSRSSDGWKEKSKPASVLMVESLAIRSAVLMRRFSRSVSSSANRISMASRALVSPRRQILCGAR